jgi:hypothetical protein
VLEFCCEGSNELSAEEEESAEMFGKRGRRDMARCVREERKMQMSLDQLLAPHAAGRDE